MTSDAKRKTNDLQFIVSEKQSTARQLNTILAAIGWTFHFISLILLIADILPINFWSGVFVTYVLIMAVGWGYNATKMR